MIGPRSFEAISEVAVVEWRPPITVKGKAGPIDTYVLGGLRHT